MLRERRSPEQDPNDRHEAALRQQPGVCGVGRSCEPASTDESPTIRDGEVIELRIDVAQSEVLRQLGYCGNREPRESVGERINSLWQPACECIRPRGSVCRLCERDARSTGMPAPEGGGWAALVTIGSELENEAARFQEEGDLLGALIFDCYGSAAAECAADALERLITVEARRLGLSTRSRVSPGYGSWDVARQADLLAFLPMSKLGMRLTDGMMMVPRKSVSFFTGAADTATPGEGETACSRCEDADTCRYRRGR